MKRRPPSTNRRSLPVPEAGPGPRPLAIVMVDRQRKHVVRKDDLQHLLQQAATALKVKGELALVFAGDPLLRRLNRDYRFMDKPTDVLSFESQDQDLGLGDIVISVETARKNALRGSRTLDRELEILALHGFLHLLGYDHETDQGEMEALEKRLRARLLTRQVAA